MINVIPTSGINLFGTVGGCNLRAKKADRLCNVRGVQRARLTGVARGSVLLPKKILDFMGIK